MQMCNMTEITVERVKELDTARTQAQEGWQFNKYPMPDAVEIIEETKAAIQAYLAAVDVQDGGFKMSDEIALNMNKGV
jgi:hypothetical protein